MTDTLVSGFPLTVFSATLFPLTVCFATLLICWQLLPRMAAQYLQPRRRALPFKLKLIWPAVVVFSALINWTGFKPGREQLVIQLRKSGLNELLSPEQFTAIKMSNAALGWVLAKSLLAFGGQTEFILTVAIGMFGFFGPNIWLHNAVKTQQKRLVSDLPSVIEFLHISLVAGLNFSAALQQVVKKGPNGPLKLEFAEVIRDIRTGQTRIAALQNSALRIDSPEYSALVQTISQAEANGASLTESLRIQGEQRRNERFLRAEKAALEAPVKLIFPLVVFIFPVSFLILLFPVASKFLLGI